MSGIPVAICRFSKNNFKRIFFEKERLFLVFYCISEICMKFRTFWKKAEYPSLIITEIIASERDIYLSV